VALVTGASGGIGQAIVELFGKAGATLFLNGVKEEKLKKYVFDSIPLGRLAEPEEVAYATLFLATDFADMITGHILIVDGGWTIK
jgi:NAD(P)-dependent dehydrogenase (short-subunit alcohol dehydrogenase family)